MFYGLHQDRQSGEAYPAKRDVSGNRKKCVAICGGYLFQVSTHITEASQYLGDTLLRDTISMWKDIKTSTSI